MKAVVRIFAVVSLGAAPFSGVDASWENWSPASREIARYEHIWRTSPFVAATEVTQAKESLASRFGLTGFARIDGQDIVFVFDRQSMQRFAVKVGKESYGVNLVSLETSTDIKQMRARIKVGTEVADISFDTSSQGGSGAATSPQMASPQTSVADNNAREIGDPNFGLDQNGNLPQAIPASKKRELKPRSGLRISKPRPQAANP